MPDVALSGLNLPRTEVTVAGRRFRNVGDRAVVALLTAASWVLQKLPGQVIEDQRADVIRALAEAKELAVVVVCGPAPAIRIYDGQRLLVEIPARQ